MTPEEKKNAINLFISSANEQAELLMTLSVSVCGGIIALIFQILIFNKKGEGEVIPLKKFWLCTTAFFFLFVATAFAYLVKGNLASLAFTLNGATIDALTSIAQQSQIPGLSVFRVLSLIQAGSFLIGVGMIFAFSWFNYKEMTKQ